MIFNLDFHSIATTSTVQPTMAKYLNQVASDNDDDKDDDDDHDDDDGNSKDVEIVEVAEVVEMCTGEALQCLTGQ